MPTEHQVAADPQIKSINLSCKSTRILNIIIMAALCSRSDIIFLPCGFFFFLRSSIFFFPHLFLAIADWMSTVLSRMMWP